MKEMARFLRQFLCVSEVVASVCEQEDGPENVVT